MSNLDLSLVSNQGLQLPFKPFTREEVENVTQAPASLIETLWGRVIPERIGDVGFMPGLDWMGCFAVFVASKWLHEGSGVGRAIGAAIFVSNLGHDEMVAAIGKGDDFPTPTSQGGILVPHPNSTLGNRLNLNILNREFRDRLDQVFSKRVSVNPEG